LNVVRCARRWAHDVVELLGCTFRAFLNVGTFQDHHPVLCLGLDAISMDGFLDTLSLFEVDKPTESSSPSSNMLDGVPGEALECEWLNMSWIN